MELLVKSVAAIGAIIENAMGLLLWLNLLFAIGLAALLT